MQRCGDYKGQTNDEKKKAGCYLYGDDIASYKEQLLRDYPSFGQIRYEINKNGKYIHFTHTHTIYIYIYICIYIYTLITFQA